MFNCSYRYVYDLSEWTKTQTNGLNCNYKIKSETESERERERGAIKNLNDFV